MQFIILKIAMFLDWFTNATYSLTQFLSEWVQKRRRFSEIMFALSVGIILKKPKILTFLYFFFKFSVYLSSIHCVFINYSILRNRSDCQSRCGWKSNWRRSVHHDPQGHPEHIILFGYIYLAFRGKIVMQFINLQIAMLLDLVANAKIKEHINLFG